MDNQHTDCYLPMELIELAFIREHFDDDDCRGERKSEGYIQGWYPLKSPRQDDEEPNAHRDKHLRNTGGQRHQTRGANQADVEFEPHQEQQDGDPKLGEQLDFLPGRNQAQKGRAQENPHQDVGNDEGLAQKVGKKAHHRSDEKNKRYLTKSTLQHASESSKLASPEPERPRPCKPCGAGISAPVNPATPHTREGLRLPGLHYLRPIR